MPRNWYKKEAQCGACRHFRRHYIKCGKGYRALHLGHCMFPRIKARGVDEGCPRWEPIPKEDS